MRIREFELREELLKAIDDLGFEEATEIQEKAIPLVLQGRDIIGQSQTGTGKTLAFSLPSINKIEEGEKKVKMLVLAPTREIVVQVKEKIKEYTKYLTYIKCVDIIGGAPIDSQMRRLLKHPQIVVGTPGRVIDLINRKKLDLSELDILTLDEADEMLKMGFEEDIEKILSSVNEDRQTLLFSATFPQGIKKISKKYQSNPEHLIIEPESLTAKTINQVYFNVKDNNKLDAICRVIDTYSSELTIVFCNTKRKVDEVTESLITLGYNCDKIHGDLPQSTRLDVLNKFNNKVIEMIVATDVAARGLDIKNVNSVINYDTPEKPDYYVHRIGRTGRAGQEGNSFLFVSRRDTRKLKDIERYIGQPIRKRNIPSLEKSMQVKAEKFKEYISNKSAEYDNEIYINFANELLSHGVEPNKIIAALVSKCVDLETTSSSHDLNEDFSNDRSNRDSRGSRGSRGGSRYDGESVRFFISVGRKDGISINDIVGMVASECKISGREITRVKVMDKFSFFSVPTDVSDSVFKKLQRTKIRRKKFNIEISDK